MYLINIICQYKIATISLKALNEHTMSPLLLPFIFIFFFLDVFLISFFSLHLITFIFCLYTVFLFLDVVPPAITFFTLFLYLTEEFLFDGRFGIQLLYLVPLSLILLNIRSLINPHARSIPCLFLGTCFITQLLLTKELPSYTYIFLKIAANLVVLVLCLKYMVKGRLDNRLYPSTRGKSGLLTS